MRNDLDQFLLRDAILKRKVEMERQLLQSAHSHQRDHSDEAAVTFRQLGTFPYVAEQDLVRQVRQFAGILPHGSLSMALFRTQLGFSPVENKLDGFMIASKDSPDNQKVLNRQSRKYGRLT
ncbi:hypothetical protein FEMY_19200 [Ferrovum myxofaciens]|uniref:Uncharacterized protein n=1 Tax=Ferrovum myxofaciens TaxID=416213 RepID=A0A149VWE7_9PROT|nr:hypothetical protein FEMY_19200 [Ferrovum myxofaciens]